LQKKKKGRGILNKTILIIVPHPDDELNIGGALLPMLKKRGYVVKVMIVTNGDAECSAKVRLKESIKGLKILGIEEKNIIFLGYGNRWDGKTHIYNDAENVRAMSFAGKTHTYALENHHEYHFQKYKEHCKYTKCNMKRDIKESIMDILADVIICVDFDSHSDHRAVSLLFEEVMGEILNNTSYRPLILKRFAYAFAWHSNKFYMTKKIGRDRVFDNRFELDNPYYEWKRKILIDLPDFNEKKPVFLNRLYIAALAYQSQDAKSHIKCLLKRNMVFWNRRTDSLLYDAEITVSSGDKKYLTDFKRFDCDDVNCVKFVQDFWNPCAWMPAVSDSEKCIIIRLQEEKFVSSISICAAILFESVIQNCDIILDSQTIQTGYLFPGKEKIIDIKKKVTVIMIQITNYIGMNPGLSEIEIYSEENQRQLLEFLKSTERKE